MANSNLQHVHVSRPHSLLGAWQLPWHVGPGNFDTGCEKCNQDFLTSCVVVVDVFNCAVQTLWCQSQPTLLECSLSQHAEPKHIDNSFATQQRQKQRLTKCEKVLVVASSVDCIVCDLSMDIGVLSKFTASC